MIVFLLVVDIVVLRGCVNLIFLSSVIDEVGEEIEDGELIDDDSVVEEKLACEKSPSELENEKELEKEERSLTNDAKSGERGAASSNEQCVDTTRPTKRKEELEKPRSIKDETVSNKDYVEHRKTWKRKGGRRNGHKDDIDKKHSKKFRRRRCSGSYDSPSPCSSGGINVRLRDENEDDYETLFVRGASPVSTGETNSVFAGYGCSYSEGRREKTHEDIEKRDFTPSDNGHKGDSGKEAMSPHEGESKRGSALEKSSSRRLEKFSAPRNDKHSRKSRARKGGKNKRKSPKGKGNGSTDICSFYMQGKCHKKNECLYSHNCCPPRKMEVCRYYLMDACTKKNKCLYMHQDFPCKFFHTGLKCYSGDKCKFSHGHLSEAMRTALSKHLKTAPKTIPKPLRLGHENMVITNYATDVRKIPSLFDIQVPIPAGMSVNRRDVLMDRSPNNPGLIDTEQDGQDGTTTPMPQSPSNDIRGYNRLWGSDDTDLIQSFKYDTRMDCEMTEIMALGNPFLRNDLVTKADNAFGYLKMQYFQERPFCNSPSKENSNTKISEMSCEETVEQKEVTEIPNKDSTSIPLHLPKKQLELFLRIQKQQREAQSCGVSKTYSIRHTESETNRNNPGISEEKCSSDEEDNLSNIMQNIYKKDQCGFTEETSSSTKSCETSPLPIQMQDLNKIQKDESVIKLLSSIDLKNILNTASVSTTCTSLRSLEPPTKKIATRDPRIVRDPMTTDLLPGAASMELRGEISPLGTKESIPSDIIPSTASLKSSGCAIRRDPRTSKDSLHIRLEKNDSKSRILLGSPVSLPNHQPSDEMFSVDYKSSENEVKCHDMEVDTRKPEVHNETNLRNPFPIATTCNLDMCRKLELSASSSSNIPFGDVDLRVRSNDLHVTRSDVSNNDQPSSSGTHRDVDWRMFPFKPVPMHTPATEIDASILSHPPIPYRVMVITIPVPDYSSLKMNFSDPQIQRDPRLCKISESQYLRRI